ncbi:MAG: glycoside hydrolase family 3 C-terminal domain-containing protein [Clostridiales bacterium]|jgi:beta-glucosidase|nr:glycoside hydrolase family 3 C-terminal domain-containing protein [Clostridiales bacterium]
MNPAEIERLVDLLSLEEKASLCSGLDNWRTKPIERLGIPNIMMSDGPHGLRVNSGTANDINGGSVPTVCFPSACASAASFDRDLLHAMGNELGRQCQALGVDVLLGPGVNIKRSPLGGRNFEYFSEDPCLAGELGVAYSKGAQRQGVGVCVKHFFANNQEYLRMSSSSEADERTFREIYLSAFETVVKIAKPIAVMASYNKIGGVFSTENKKHLTELLRNEWGFDGLVVSDWGATHSRVGAIKAGCDLTMPAESTDSEIVEAINAGELQKSDLDNSARRILQLVFKMAESSKRGSEVDFVSGHELARKIASESIVLLKNDKNVLPLSKSQKVAFIGEFADSPRFQGGGSSHVHAEHVTSARDAAINAGVELVDEMAAADVAVLFIGLTEAEESEGFDRAHLRLSDAHEQLVEEACALCPNVVVVLHNGGPVEMPWVDKPKAIVEAYLGGEAIGEAIVDVLFGKVNPCGRLPETFPKKLSDTPSYLSFPGERGIVKYQEGVFVGYRYYATKELDPLFPFGFGLSYTKFEYQDLSIDKAEMDEDDVLTVSVRVTNTGMLAGKEVVQLYIAPEKGEVIRPLRELKKFEKISLEPGETKTVSFELSKRDFAYWSEYAHDWQVEEGIYNIEICEHSMRVSLSTPVKVKSDEKFQMELSETSTISDFVRVPAGKEFVENNIGYALWGMAQMGLSPTDTIKALGIEPGAPVSLERISSIGKLFSQPVSLLLGFIPESSKKELQEILKFAGRPN